MLLCSYDIILILSNLKIIIVFMFGEMVVCIVDRNFFVNSWKYVVSICDIGK